jgi:hypothetical protein
MIWRPAHATAVKNPRNIARITLKWSKFTPRYVSRICSLLSSTSLKELFQAINAPKPWHNLLSGFYFFIGFLIDRIDKFRRFFLENGVPESVIEKCGLPSSVNDNYI